ncbi:MAG: type I-E CRISPR-associated protein Cas6/Cse3/CasE [Erysipelotrichaceae bacterium]|nr:type I-E CRISPR-associated protein Cas6/Cse3/CasE [Erysipelotrichaceae bacterium]
MYLSKVKLNLRKKKTIKCLENPNCMHGVVERISNGKGGKLWRVDRINGVLSLLVLSSEFPHLEDLIEQIGDENIEPGILSYDSFLEKVEEKKKYYFVLQGNTSSKSDGKRRSLKDDDQRMNWLMKKGEANGFCVDPCQTAILQSGPLVFKRNKETITLASTLFQGILYVTDREKFLKALMEGVGHGKSYGLGMLSIMV